MAEQTIEKHPESTRTRTTAIKAYMVQEEAEGTGGIVYSKSNAQARREGAEQFAGGEWECVTCRRAPDFDGLERDPRARTRLLLAKGWWFKVDNGHGYVTADDEPWVSKEGDVYRSPFQWLSDREARINRRLRDERIRSQWSERLWARWWFADDIRVHVEPSGCVDARIDLPYLRDGVRFLERAGGKHTVSLRDLPTYQRAYRINADAEMATT